MLRMLLAIVFVCCTELLSAQQRNVVRFIVVDGDTLPYVMLQEVKVRARAPLWYSRQYRRRTRLELHVRKVYPYARIAARKVAEIEYKLSRAGSEADRRKIIRKEYSELMKTFKAPLMRLSIRQGRILIRLIYRETSHTSFAHIKEYRGTVAAYFWQSVARIFGNNLKSAYDPEGEDREIEEIVQKILKGE